ncbi:MAG: hypothetical protein WAX14_11600 [Rhodococcus sp. (in: high G+C Gram-positive bacteria)]|uniref:hypothetical protein n=1 Tax=Rhodococcus sp. TaxID=1831 RepID=UPI003BB51192
MANVPPAERSGFHVRPTLRKQCWGFVIGAACFAIGSAPVLAGLLGTSTVNVVFFVGAWFFTGAGLIQLLRSGPMTAEHDGQQVIRADWLSAAVQSVGTLLFNVSTAAALQTYDVIDERHFVWRPDAAGSVAFLISGALALRVYTDRERTRVPRGRDGWAVWLNLLGCVAFGVSAVGAFVTGTGAEASDFWANAGTFVGALCFLVSALLSLRTDA